MYNPRGHLKKNNCDAEQNGQSEAEVAAAAAAAPAVAFSSGYIAVTTARPFCKRGMHFLPRKNTHIHAQRVHS